MDAKDDSRGWPAAGLHGGESDCFDDPKELFQTFVQRLYSGTMGEDERVVCDRSSKIPSVPRDLQAHQCIVLRKSDAAYSTWNLTRGNRQESVKIRGGLSTNDGESGVLWALEGFGILMLSEWNVQAHLDSGRLVPVLKDWSLPSADVFAVYPERANLSAKVSVFVDFLVDWFGQEATWVK